MLEDRLNNLLILHNEKDIVIDYEKVLNAFIVINIVTTNSKLSIN